MQNELPGVWACAYLCVCICEYMDCALAFAAVPGYHENTSDTAAQTAQAAEPVTYDYTYHPLSRAQEAGEKKVGSERKREDREVGEKEGGRTMRTRVVK